MDEKRVNSSLGPPQPYLETTSAETVTIRIDLDLLGTLPTLLRISSVREKAAFDLFQAFSSSLGM
uniref:Uncharacterized protein n=1 Tax=Glossina palpalis gambiensis TaxID=67801 RepID=A0A1B0ARB6_9MUSC